MAPNFTHRRSGLRPNAPAAAAIAFSGGFATGLDLGLTPQERVTLAQASLAQNASGLGSQAEVRDMAHTQEFIATIPHRSKV